MTSKNSVNVGLCLGLGIFSTSLAFGAGFEQEVMWSGKNAGMASAVTSTVAGPEALYFNPAGLVTGAEEDAKKNELSFNVSYLQSKFSAPVTTPNDSVDSKDGNNIAGSILYSRQIGNDLAVGIGVFPSGGLSVEYDTVDLGGVSGAPKADLKIIELSSGIAYKPTSDLTFGLAYRITYSTADLTVLDPLTPAVVEFKGLKGWDFFSFRGGVQYKREKWGTGLSVRTPIIFKVKGDVELRSPAPTATDDNASISTTFPLMISYGGFIKPTSNLTLMLDYDFLNYKQADDLAVETSLGLPNQDLKWDDGHIIRLGAEYVIQRTTLRTGYVYSTAITNPDTMNSTTEAPGPGHSFTVGAGYKFSDNLVADLALFYGFGEKKVDSTTALSGDYKVSGFAAHSGLAWKF